MSTAQQKYSAYVVYCGIYAKVPARSLSWMLLPVRASLRSQLVSIRDGYLLQ